MKNNNKLATLPFTSATAILEPNGSIFCQPEKFDCRKYFSAFSNILNIY